MPHVHILMEHSLVRFNKNLEENMREYLDYILNVSYNPRVEEIFGLVCFK